MNAVAETLAPDTGEMPAPLIFTDSAAAKVAELIAEEGNPDLKLRVFVQGGGCSGFQYGFTFDEITNDDDTTMTKNGVSLLIDAMSYQYLVGAEIEMIQLPNRERMMKQVFEKVAGDFDFIIIDFLNLVISQRKSFFEMQGHC